MIRAPDFFSFVSSIMALEDLMVQNLAAQVLKRFWGNSWMFCEALHWSECATEQTKRYLCLKHGKTDLGMTACGHCELDLRLRLNLDLLDNGPKSFHLPRPACRNGIVHHGKC